MICDWLFNWKCLFPEEFAIKTIFKQFKKEGKFEDRRIKEDSQSTIVSPTKTALSDKFSKWIHLGRQHQQNSSTCLSLKRKTDTISLYIYIYIERERERMITRSSKLEKRFIEKQNRYYGVSVLMNHLQDWNGWY